MLKHRGLRLSMIGAVIFLAGIAGLLFLPSGIAKAAIVGGGMLVWFGFIWTLMSYYLPSKPPES